MTLRMADSVTWQNLPGGMDAYAGYGNGRYQNYDQVVAAHPGVPVLDISVVFANLGDAEDIEPGDADVSQAPGYVIERTLAGVWRPVLYCSQSNVPAVVAACTAYGINRNSYRIWSAHYSPVYGAHICGPVCGIPYWCDGTQWIDHGPWDESLLNDNFFAPAPVPVPPIPNPTPPPAPKESHNMAVAVPTGGSLAVRPDGGVFNFNGAGFYGSVPGLKVTINNAIGIAPTKTGKGYWVAGSDGGVYAFGDAQFHGSAPEHPEWGIGTPTNPVVGIATDQAQPNGYILFADNGTESAPARYYLNATTK